MILRPERAPIFRQLGEHLQRPCFVNQNVAAAASSYSFLCRARITRDDNTAVRCVETISIALHGVLGGEGRDRYFLVPVNYTGFDVVRVHLPAFRVGTLVAAWGCTCLDINSICLQN